MPIQKKSISSIGDLLRALPSVFGTPKRTVWFRGHSCEDWKLLPSLIRPPNRADDEIVFFKRFKQHAFPFLDRIPQYEWEWLFLMQHYGVPTRLLDWSESPLVGMYFALLEPSARRDKSKNAVLWCLYPNELNSISNLNLNPPYDIPCFGDDQVLESYLPSRVIGVQSAVYNPLAIIAPRQFKRLYAQQGVFTLFHRNQSAIEVLGNQSHIFKLVIPVAAKDNLRKELEYLMINQLALFPELEKVGRRVYEIQP